MYGRWGLGPVFSYEWRTLSRRWQLYGLRALLVAVLGAALAVVWLAKVPGTELTRRALATAGESFFYALVGTQLALVLLAAPAYTAGAICWDKAQGVLLHLLATDLSDGEIILGKLAARLVPVLGLVACSLPVLSLAVLLGGIGPEAVFGVLLVTLGVGVLGGTLALTLSVWCKKSYEVLLATYLLFAVVLLAKPLWSVLSARGRIPSPPSWLELTNPFELAFLPYLRPAARALEEQAVFLALTVALAVALAILAIRRVRPVSLRQAGSPAWPAQRRVGLRMFDLPGWLPGLSLDDNPILWREWHRDRSSRWGRAAWALYAGLASLFSLLVPTVQTGLER